MNDLIERVSKRMHPFIYLDDRQFWKWYFTYRFIWGKKWTQYLSRVSWIGAKRRKHDTIKIINFIYFSTACETSIGPCLDLQRMHYGNVKIINLYTLALPAKPALGHVWTCNAWATAKKGSTRIQEAEVKEAIFLFFFFLKRGNLSKSWRKKKITAF